MTKSHRGKFFANDEKAPLTAEDVEAFMADLEVSIAAFQTEPASTPKLPQASPAPAPAAFDIEIDFDLIEPAAATARGVAAPAPSPREPAPAASAVAAPAISPAAVPAASAAPASSPLAASGLLAELREAAAGHHEQADRQRQSREQSQTQLAEAMRQLWTYTSELARHLNTIRPQVAQRYRLSTQIDLHSLIWTESFCDYRSLSTRERAPLDSIVLNFTLSAPGTLTIEQLPHQAKQLNDELNLIQMRFHVREKMNERRMIQSMTFTVERAVRVSLLFKADYDNGQVQLRARNLNGFGTSAYTFPAATVTQAFLDNFGYFLLGRPNKFLAAMTMLPKPITG